MKCFKCGKDRKTIVHHLSYNPEYIVDCCRSCHTTLHHRIRKEGSCVLSIKEVRLLSNKSSQRRTHKIITFSETMMPNIRLLEKLKYNLNTGNIHISSCFLANHINNIEAVP